MNRFVIVALGALACVGPSHGGEHWPGWRGPTGMGESDEKSLPLTWGGKSKENILWQAPLFPSDKVRRDQNQSSPIVWGERVFVTVSYWSEGVSEKEFPEHHVLCFRVTDGMKLWDTVVPPGPWKLTDLRGGYTAPTPACDGERVYVAFGSAMLAALDLGGKIIWRHEIVPHAFDVAIGASPVVFKDTVIFVCDQLKDRKASCIKALDAKTGEPRWEQKRPTVDWAHSTPTLALVKGKMQLNVATANGPQGLDPASGEILWYYRVGERIGDTVSPVVRDDRLYVDSGRGGAGVAVGVDGVGDVTKTHKKWQHKFVAEGFSSPVLVGAYLYRLHSPGVLSCWKWETGEVVFQERLMGVNQAVSAVSTADGRIYFASAGKSFIIQAGSKLDVLAENDLGDPSHASPAVASGRLFLKGGRNLYCVGKK